MCLCETSEQTSIGSSFHTRYKEIQLDFVHHLLDGQALSAGSSAKKVMKVNLARKVISSVLKTHLRHRAHDILASQAKECRVSVPVHEYLTTIWGDLLLSTYKYVSSVKAHLL